MRMHCLQDQSHRRLLLLVLLLAVAMVAQAEEKPHSFKKQAFISTIENRFSCLGLGEVFCRKVQEVAIPNASLKPNSNDSSL